MVAVPAAVLLDPAYPLASVEQRVREDWFLRERSEYRLCLGLRRLYVSFVHRRDSRARFGDWAEEELGVPARLASLFSFLGSHFERLPKTRAAVEGRRLTYTKAREFVAFATPEDEEEWIEYALTHTNRELERRVAERGGRPAREVRSPLNATEVQALRRAREIIRTKLDSPVPEAQMLPTLAALLADGKLVFADSKSGPPAKEPRPWLTKALCVNCLDTWIPVPGENLRIPLEEWLASLKNGADVVDLLSQFLCDCEGSKHRRDRCPAPKRTAEDRVPSRYIRREDLKIIEARDGNRCSTPGCRCGGPLQNGHLRPFRDGVPALPANVRQQCATCNALVEAGRLRITGEAPFEEYRRADGTRLGIGYDPSPRTGSDPHVGQPPGAEPGSGGSAAGPPADRS